MSLKNPKKKLDKKGAASTSDPKHAKSNGEPAPVVNKSKHIVFDDSDDEGGAAIEAVAKPQPPTPAQNKRQKHRKDGSDIGKLWYQLHAEHNTSGEPSDMKMNEIEELTSHCRRCYENELSAFEKKNPTDVKWLKTALHKGTSKDRANAGALLVQTNPAANLETLETLIAFTKVTNKNSTDTVDVLTELFTNALLPADRKLIAITLRGNDWKALKKADNIDVNTKSEIYAYWHFEATLKEHYFEFLRNLQSAIQGAQDPKKKQAIIFSAKLLIYSPEKEQMLLAMLVNKLGDPSRQIASKALHHLTEVSFKHPAMCGVMASETEKLLFRNNITEHAQHFAICFLSQLAPQGNVDVCIKLVNICVSFFKIVVDKGMINSKIMQAILLCLKHSISDVVNANKLRPGSDSGLLSKDSQDTIYRLVHFANIKVSLQTLALLLQIITALDATEHHNRFYNALYKKVLDVELTTCGAKYSALFLHIVHRAVHIDRNKSRAQAFVKRLLQASLHFPAHITCGCLIIIGKLLKSRSELNVFKAPPKVEAKADGGADNEAGDDVKPPKTATGYDPYHRVAEFAGAEFAVRTELTALLHHYHPTVRVFAENVLKNETIKFYGDPLVDFSLTHFLDRFAFKNPKKDGEQKPESLVKSIHNKNYTPKGSRGQSVQNLTSVNCSEEEKFIFAYLDKKRERRALFGLDNGGDRMDDVDDDEFDAYLDSLGGKKSGKSEGDIDDEEEFDFIGDMDEGSTKKPKHKRGEDDEAAGDWDSDDDDDDDDGVAGAGADDEDDEFDGSDAGSISLDENDDEDDEEDDDDDDDDDAPDGLFESDDDEDDDEPNDSDADMSDSDVRPAKKQAKPMSSKDFQRKLKSTSDMSSLFAAAEDFSEMLEDTGKSSKHGTLGEIFNKDKSSEKQLAWEQSRFKQNAGTKFQRSQKRARSQGKKRRGEPLKSAKQFAGGKRKRV